MTRALAADVDGLNLVGIDSAGLDWWVSDIKGWWTGPSTHVDRVQRVISHGEFAQDGHRGGRLVTVVGRVSAPTSEHRALLPSAIASLSALLADGGFGTLTVESLSEGERWAEVQLFDEPDNDWRGGMFFNYQVGLLAPDAYKYGEMSIDSTGFSQTPSGAGLVFPLFVPSGSLSWGVPVDPGILTVTNHGNADAAVVFTVDGPTPAAGFRIIELITGKRITYLGGAVPSGSSVVFDGRDGTVVIDGVSDRSGDTVVDAWPRVPPGESRSFLFESLGGFTAATLTGACTATYW